MGIFKRKAITKSNQQATNTAIKVVGDYDISFTAFNGDLYENDIVRSCIHAIASNAGKLKFGHEGSAPFNKSILYSPNSFMSSYDFIYKVVSMLYTKNNVFIWIAIFIGLYFISTLTSDYASGYKKIILSDFLNKVERP